MADTKDGPPSVLTVCVGVELVFVGPKGAAPGAVAGVLAKVVGFEHGDVSEDTAPPASLKPASVSALVVK